MRGNVSTGVSAKVSIAENMKVNTKEDIKENIKVTADYISDISDNIQNTCPIIHCITNIVTVNDCANILLAAGASPTMAHHPLEVEEITAGTQALVCNLGAIADYEAMEKAGRVAHELDHAIVVDPVGISGSTYRREKCKELIGQIHPTCIRGNYSEMRALLEDHNTVTGVDAGDNSLDVEALMSYARANRMILIASGKQDIITDGTTTYVCENGDAKMARITGSGCMSSVMLGAFLGTERSVHSAAAACAFVGIAGEYAAKKTADCGGGTITFRDDFIDEISLLTREKLECAVKVQLICD